MSRDEDRAMTVERLFFCAHQRDPVTRGALLHAIQSLTDERRRRQAIVLNFAVLVTRVILALRAHRFAEKDVGNAVGFERRLECLPIELRIEATEWRRPDVGNGGNTVLTEQREKPVRRMS